MASSEYLESQEPGLAPAMFHDDLARQLEDRLSEEQLTGRLPTLIAGLVRDGVLVWSGSRGSTGLQGGGPATVDTQYRIGSITKTFVAVLVMRLRDEGLIDLNDPIGDHLPELAALPITVAHLLSHTSGLRAETPAPWWERTEGMSFADFVRSCARTVDLWWRPGRRFHYSNPGYAVLGELVARKRSLPFGDVLRGELLEPLGMHRTTLRPVPPFVRGLAVHPHADLVLDEPEHDAVALAPAGQLWSTVEDLTRWSTVLAGQRPDVLGAESVSEMAEPLALIDGAGQPWNGAYGLGLFVWNLGGRRRYGHTGGMPGFWAILLIDQTTKDAVIGFSNSTYKGLRQDFFDDLLTLMVSRNPRRKPGFAPSPSRPDPSVLDLLGTWYWGPVEYCFSLNRDGLLTMRGGPGARECSFIPNGAGSYVGQSGYFHGELLTPHRQPDGRLSHLDLASYALTRAPYDPAADIPGGVDAKGWYPG